jgi:hypothetical protein
MENIKFIYLYRDGGNYKNWGEVIFSNPLGLTPNVITPKLNRAFMTDGMFIAHQIRIPEVLFYCNGDLTIDDHCFHEFDSVELTEGTRTDRLGRSINELLSEVKREAQAGWRAFDPYDSLQRIPRENWSQ